MLALSGVTLAGLLAAINLRHHNPPPSRGGGSGLGLLGWEHRHTEALLVRAALLMAVWFPLLRDMRNNWSLRWFVPYTHWNYLILALYAPVALASR